MPGMSGFFGSVSDIVKEVIKGRDAQIVVDINLAVKKALTGKIKKIVIIMGAKHEDHPVGALTTYEHLIKAGTSAPITVLDTYPDPNYPKGVMHILDPFGFREQLLMLFDNVQ